MTAYETLVEAAKTTTFSTQRSAAEYLQSHGFSWPKAQKAAQRWWTETHSAPAPPPSPSFLNGLNTIWSDDCSSPTPVESKRWGLYSMQRKDGVQVASTVVTDIAAGRFVQHASGGPNNKPYYEFYAPQGDTIWSDGGRGRSELSYAGSGYGGSSPGGTIWFHEGNRRVFRFAVRLPSPWDVNAGGWRILSQWKVNEGYGNPDLPYPAIVAEQINGKLGITYNGESVPRVTLPNPITANVWINLAYDITFSSDSSKGKAKMYADRNLDGVYEEESPTYYGKTMAKDTNGSEIPAQFMSGLYEGTGGDRLHKADHIISG